MAIVSEIPVLINGELYSWSSVRLQFSNHSTPTIGVTAINYSDSREITNVMGIGDRPIGRSYGSVTYEGSITLLKDEIKKLTDAAPFGDITLLGMFDISVSYRSTIGSKIYTEVIKNAEFTSNPTSISQGDTSIAVELPLVFAGIKRGSVPYL